MKERNLKISRIDELVSLIEYHDNQYWNLNDPKISDEDYDKLLNELKTLNPQHPLGNKINSPIKCALGKIKHKTPMLSLDKFYSVEEILNWCDSVSRNVEEVFRLEPKLDGIAARHYVRSAGNLIATRGDDGINGENISDKWVTILYENFNGDIPISQLTEDALGEILMKKSTFEKMKSVLLRKNGEPYKYPRSACVGILSRDGIQVNADQVLSFVDYNKFSAKLTLNQLHAIDWVSYINNVKNWDYPTDGLVIKLDDAAYSDSLGFTNHHPKGQMALKFDNPFVHTKLVNVIWQIGKNKLTPVGIVEPVVIAGATVTRVSLHNAKNIIDRDIQIGDIVKLERAGEIIPYVKSSVPGEVRVRITIDICPECGTALIYNNPDLLCPNIQCQGKLVRLLGDAVKRIGIDNLGEPTIEKMIDILNVECLFDILTLEPKELFQLPGFAEVSVMKLYLEMQRVITNPIEDWKFLSALNLKGIGAGLCKSIFKQIKFDQLFKMSVDDLVDLNQLGYDRALVLVNGLNSEKEHIDSLLSILTVVDTFSTATNAPVGVVCFTGKSDIKRDDWVKLANSANYEFSKSITSSVTILVSDNPNSNKNKMKKARDKGIHIMSYDDFNCLVSNKV